VGAILSISAVVGAFFVRRPADMMHGAPVEH
jgi:MFS transporter, DHA2 family, lincomycin resistance protein